ncbi:MAG: ATP-dependent DNA helicase RecG [Rhodospirillaceae bacterium]|nr:ATP-dependent DNA helicase RecG [Rhodospirillaceae bacterium]
MRPESLFPLFSDINALPGIGPRLKTLVERVAGPRIVDLIWTLPTGLIDRRYSPKIADAASGKIATITVMIDSHEVPGTPKRPYRVICSDDSGSMTLAFFNARKAWLEAAYPIGQQRVVSGRVEEFQGRRQITHPDFVATPEEAESLRTVQPVYPLTEGLTQHAMKQAIDASLDRTVDLPEWVDQTLVSQRRWPSWRAALQLAHRPQGPSDLTSESLARSRLAYDELLATQLALLLVRERQRRIKGRSLAGSGELQQRILDSLPFSLTDGQRTALREINADMHAPTRMTRMLQGDVGSGKTVVALLAMATAAEVGGQAALMAPTELLAQQHFETIRRFAEVAGLRVELLTSRKRGSGRKALKAAIEGGDVSIIVGTHALFSEDVVFRDLALVIIDEQHRFGVQQRLALASKGDGVDTLTMTATPIPRTMMLAAYGDIETSKLIDKPVGRKPVDTRAMPMDRLYSVVASVKRRIANGSQVFWICPLINDSDALDLTAATKRHAWLQQEFGSKVALVHGKMKAVEKDAAMQRFINNDAAILVATTIVEVGVDVPNASIMIVEHAERFGLAQLHQLRGRIGRGTRKSFCFLLYDAPLGEMARARIDVLRKTSDGFEIADEDLRLREYGEVLGTQQSGMPAFKLARFPEHSDLLEIARSDARVALDRDPDLLSDRGEALRRLLYLFEREEGVRMILSG